MATALFQCFDEESAFNLQSMRPCASVFIHNVEQSDDLVSMVFDGSFAQMHWSCMDLAFMSNNTFSFIGIDQLSYTPSDPYYMHMLGTIPRLDIDRPAVVRERLNWLIEQFMDVILQLQLTDQQVWDIARQCVLGPDPMNTAEYCARVVQMCATYGRQCNYKRIIDGNRDRVYSCVCHNTMVRVMGHICYLGMAY